MLDQVLQQILGGLGVFGGAFPQRQHVFAALNIHTHGGQYALISEVHAIDVDDQQLDIIVSAGSVA